MPSNPDPDLMRIFDFTADDLEANRAGRMSERQADHQAKLVKEHNVMFVVGAIALPVVCLLAMALGAFKNSPHINEERGFWIVAVLSMSMMLRFVVIKNNKNMASDSHSGVVHYESGKIKRRTGRGEGYLKTPTRELTLYESQNKGLKQYLKKVRKEALFRIYYIPRSKRVVSMEIIDL